MQPMPSFGQMWQKDVVPNGLPPNKQAGVPDLRSVQNLNVCRKMVVQSVEQASWLVVAFFFIASSTIRRQNVAA